MNQIGGGIIGGAAGYAIGLLVYYFIFEEINYTNIISVLAALAGIPVGVYLAR